MNILDLTCLNSPKRRVAIRAEAGHPHYVTSRSAFELFDAAPHQSRTRTCGTHARRACVTRGVRLRAGVRRALVRRLVPRLRELRPQEAGLLLHLSKPFLERHTIDAGGQGRARGGLGGQNGRPQSLRLHRSLSRHPFAEQPGPDWPPGGAP